MEVKATLSPGQNGTEQLLKAYGDQLVCVRYRYDKARQKRIKTGELITTKPKEKYNLSFIQKNMFNWSVKVNLKRPAYGEKMRIVISRILKP